MIVGANPTYPVSHIWPLDRGFDMSELEEPSKPLSASKEDIVLHVPFA